MTPSRRWTLFALLVLPLATVVGCNPGSLAFLLRGDDPKAAPLMHRIAPDDKDKDTEKEVSVVILAVAGLETRSELIRADRELENLLVLALREGCKQNREKVKVVSPSKVQDFKSENPDWRKWDPEEVGKHFKADWVVWLEMGALSLYEKGSSNQLYRGRAEINVTLVDVNSASEQPKLKTYSDIYPGEARPAVEVGETNPAAFRQAFLTHVADQLSWYFTAHSTEKEHDCK